MARKTSPPEPGELRSLLQRNWMTHDAMWFAAALARVGIEDTNAMNRAAVRSMAAIEARRIRKLFGLGPITCADDVRRFFDCAIGAVIPDFMDFSETWAPDNTSVSFQIARCFAFDGVTALGVADRYECGIYERIHGWLDELGLGYSVTPDVAHCTMFHDGSCVRRFTFDLPACGT